MRDRDNPALDEAADRRGAARAESAGPQDFPAAAAGRPEVLGPAGMLRMQRVAGNAGTASMAEGESDTGLVHRVIGSGGSAIDDTTRTDMEQRFGHDFGDVRIHTGPEADRSARSLNAQAYTVGTDIVFRDGGYSPGSDSGRHVLAHELTHVVQQRSGPVDGTDVGGGVQVSDPGDRFEREAAQTADAVMSAPAPVVPSAATAAPAGVQRVPEEEPEEAAVQAVQRETEDLDEESA
ncbi:uncharacterized protein DUF4157 [Stackebrandtia albiflava]|uniref:Uncharacterized protein DUF4157 n=1 Tax=Stackebrandtia albiflava TaxID=406432 RepID=A0A562UPY0_9ACTN|nr:DUF4157 domain-containing protein [Stackebrandtia albiflava]TWJ07668.1 uncharacterized protein DUF4157 [Stackebrandtia albiflava]